MESTNPTFNDSKANVARLSKLAMNIVDKFEEKNNVYNHLVVTAMNDLKVLQTDTSKDLEDAKIMENLTELLKDCVTLVFHGYQDRQEMVSLDYVICELKKMPEGEFSIYTRHVQNLKEQLHGTLRIMDSNWVNIRNLYEWSAQMRKVVKSTEETVETLFRIQRQKKQKQGLPLSNSRGKSQRLSRDRYRRRNVIEQTKK